MSEDKSVRTSQQINNENINLQLKAGGVQYMIAEQQKQLAMINDRMRDLAIEYVELKAKEDAEAKLRKEIEDQVRTTPKLESVPDQNPVSEVNQASTQSGSEAVPTPSQSGPDEQGNKKE